MLRFTTGAVRRTTQRFVRGLSTEAVAARVGEDNMEKRDQYVASLERNKEAITGRSTWRQWFDYLAGNAMKKEKELRAIEQAMHAVDTSSVGEYYLTDGDQKRIKYELSEGGSVDEARRLASRALNEDQAKIRKKYIFDERSKNDEEMFAAMNQAVTSIGPGAPAYEGEMIGRSVMNAYEIQGKRIEKYWVKQVGSTIQDHKDIAPILDAKTTKDLFKRFSCVPGIDPEELKVQLGISDGQEIGR